MCPCVFSCQRLGRIRVGASADAATPTRADSDRDSRARLDGALWSRRAAGSRRSGGLRAASPY